MVSLVLTCIGPDRPGLVEAISATVKASEANWEESRMAQLAGQFAGILRVTVSEANEAALVDALGALEGLRVMIARSAAQPPTAAQHHRLELTGNDRPGIVNEVSAVLAMQGVNVESLQTTCVSAPMSGGNLFKATALLSFPEGTDSEKLRDSLEALADDLMVDIALATPNT